MTKEQFDDLFAKTRSQLLPKTKDEIKERMSHYAKDPNHIKLEELTSYLQVESVKYTNALVYNLLLEIAVEK